MSGKNIVYDGGDQARYIGMRRIPLADELQDDTTDYLIVRRWWEPASNHLPFSQGAINTPDVGSTHFLVNESEQDGAGYYERTFAPIPAVDALPQPYSISTYIIAEHDKGISKTSAVPRGAQQVGQVALEAARTERYVTGATSLNLRWSTRTITASETVEFSYLNGDSDAITYVNTKKKEVTITIWAATKGEEAPLATPIDVTAERRRDFFLVGAGQTYTKPTAVPVRSKGLSLGGGFEVLEPSTLSRWRGNIFVRETLCTNQAVVTQKFRSNG